MQRATFFGLEIGRTGLTTAQFGLDVTGHNIANVDTKGYTRQRIVSTAYDPFSTIGRFLPVDQALVGGGVRIDILDQIRSQYLDRRYRSEFTVNSYWERRTESLTYLESFFDNVNEKTSINYSIAEFFRAMKILAEDPVAGAPRTLLQTAAMDLVQQLNLIYDGLVDLQTVENKALATKTGDINRLAKELVELNKAIYGFEITGMVANDLRDKRNLIIDQLAGYIDVEYEEYPDKYGHSMFRIKIGGEILVDHDKRNELGVYYEDNPLEGGVPIAVPSWMRDQITGLNINGVTITNNGQEITTNVYDAANNINRITGGLHALNQQIAILGIQIAEATAAGNATLVATLMAQQSLLKDERLDLAAELQDYADVIYNDSDPAVALGNAPLVITLDNGADTILVDGSGARRVSFTEEPDYVPLNITGGEMKAHRDMRDGVGNGADSTQRGIPYYIEMVNDLARALVYEINSIHVQGWSDNPLGSKTGILFFDDLALTPTVRYFDADGVELFDPDDPDIAYAEYNITEEQLRGITAKNIALSADIIASAYNIACSEAKISRSDEGDSDELQRHNNKNINKLYDLFRKTGITMLGRDIGSFDDYGTVIRFDVGNTLHTAKKAGETSRILTLAAENQRTAIAGVSLDEEMVGLVKYQHAYNGAARVITAMDDALDRLINGTGRVGL